MLRFICALIFFTRLPFFQRIRLPDNYFEDVIYFWPFAGWITAIVMAAVLYGCSFIFPLPLAVIIAIASRVLLTGALHEDGLADFCDGFGGGTTKERILAIMKDSHIGCYGVIGLILYFLCLYSSFTALPVMQIVFAILVADPFCKGLASLITGRLSYARQIEQSKARVIYAHLKAKFILPLIVFMLIPLVLISYFVSVDYAIAIILPAILFFLLTGLMKRKIQGYTGDCIGALFLLLELSYYLMFIALRSLP